MTAPVPVDVRGDIVTSRDGFLGIQIVKFHGIYPLPNRTAEGAYFAFIRSPQHEVGRVGVLFSDLFRFVRPDAFGLPDTMNGNDFMVHCALAAIGEYLDTNGLLTATAVGQKATEIECLSERFDDWSKRDRLADEQLLDYIRGKLFWSWTYGQPSAKFSAADVIRFNAPLSEFDRIAGIEEGHLWTLETKPDDLTLRHTPEFLRDERDRRQRMKGVGSATDPAVLLAAPRYAGPAEHWRKAEAFAQGSTRDLANAAKEAVCAVEGLAKIVTGEHTLSLGELIKELTSRFNIDGALAKSLSSLWGFASNSPGVRHGGARTATIGDREAQFVLESSAAAIRLLLALDQ
jgi:hypothetical protein